MWYVIQVRTGREDEAAGELKRLGIHALVPKENRLIRREGRWTRRVYVLFGGYVFLDMTYSAENYYRVKKVPGFVRFLGEQGNPSRLSFLEAEWIRMLAGKDNTPVEPTVVRADGGRLKAVEGILECFENRVVRWDRRNRKATFEVTVCGERKEVQLSILLEEDLQRQGAGEDAGEGTDTEGEGLQEAG